MKLTPIKANMTEISLPDTDTQFNRRLLFSYSTPVAYAETTAQGRSYYRTKERYSVTTSRHINQWLPKDQAEERSQEFFDSLAQHNLELRRTLEIQ